MLGGNKKHKARSSIVVESMDGSQMEEIINDAGDTQLLTSNRPDSLGPERGYPLLIKRIAVRELVNVEMLGGKNDPFLEIRMGSWYEKTEVIEEAGSMAEWDLSRKPFKIEATDSFLGEKTSFLPENCLIQFHNYQSPIHPLTSH